MASTEETAHEYGIKLTPIEALRPADAVILAVAHKEYVAGGWPLIARLLKDRSGYRARCEVEARSRRKSRKGSICGGYRSPANHTGTDAMADGPILVTGAAGFIGFHVAKRLLRDGHDVVGLDNMNAYYDPTLKEARRADLAKSNRFRFVKLDLADREGMAALFKEHRFPYVVHLAAQAGVRYSLVDPFAYVDANLTGFTTILEGCRHNGCRHLLYASSSSVYGSNTKMPFSVHDNVDHP